MTDSLGSRVATFEADVNIIHQIANGDTSTVVETAGGPVRSVAKLIADNQATLGEAYPDAGTYTGAETMWVSRGAGLLQTTLTNIATFILSIFTIMVGAATGLIARTVIAELLDLPVSVKRFGAKGDGTTDDTAAIQNALNASKSVFLPPGTYQISELLSCPSAGISFIGKSRGSTIIRQTALNVGVFSDAGFASTRFANLTLTYAGTATSGATALSLTGFYSSADNFAISNAYVGASSSGTSGSYANSIGFNNFQIQNCISSSLQLIYAYNVNISNFFLTASNNTQVSAGHLVLQNGQGHNFVTGEIFGGLSSAALSNYQYCKFSQVYFDSAAQGAVTTTATGISFVDCWFSGGRSGAGFPGMTVGTFAGTDTSVGVNFFGCEFINCGGDGALVYAGPVNTNFTGCLIGSNSATAGANQKHGLEFAAGCSHFSVTNCQINNSLGTLGTQAYGVLVNSGASNNYTIANNDIKNNGTGSISDLGTGTNKLVFNPSTQSTLTLPFNTASTSTSTGSLVVAGGVGISGTTNTAGSINVSYSGAAINLSDTSGAQKTQVVFKNGLTTAWDIGNTSSNGNFAIDRWVGGSFVNSPLAISNATGIITITNGVVSPNYSVGSVQVIGAQITGYGVPTGNVKLPAFPGASATLAQTSAQLAQLIVDLKTHGLLGA